jgi:hypothetical protein
MADFDFGHKWGPGVLSWSVGTAVDDQLDFRVMVHALVSSTVAKLKIQDQR